MSENKSIKNKIISFALIAIGTAMFFSIPEKMVEIEKTFSPSDFNRGFINLSFYLIAVLCVLGGILKLKNSK